MINVNQSDSISLCSNTGSNLLYYSPFRTLSIDWLSVSCRRNFTQNRLYSIVKAKYGNNVWADVEVYSIDKRKIFTLFSRPRNPLVPVDTCIAKFENSVLYSADFGTGCIEFLHYAGLDIVKVNRIDLALDFQRFDNNMHPQTLIDRLLSKKISKNGKSNFAANGKTSTLLKIDYIRFGSRSSPVSVYMYNKSQEFRDMYEKGYISDIWDKAGRTNSDDVYRIEISINHEQKLINDIQTGEIVRMDIFNYLDVYYKKVIFWSLFQRYFSFKVVDENTRKQYWKPLVLFKGYKEFKQIVSDVERIEDPNRMSRIVLNKMVVFLKENEFGSEEEFANFEESILYYAERHGLTAYLYTKLNFQQKHPG